MGSLPVFEASCLLSIRILTCLRQNGHCKHAVTSQIDSRGCDEPLGHPKSPSFLLLREQEQIRRDSISFPSSLPCQDPFQILRNDLKDLLCAI